jgi:hypothetical protein
MAQDRGITLNILYPHLCKIEDMSVSDVKLIRALLSEAMCFGSRDIEVDTARAGSLWAWFNDFLCDNPGIEDC